MKKIKLNTSKLKLSKTTITPLTNPEMRNVVGGVTQLTDQCATVNNCFTYDGCGFSGSPCISATSPVFCVPATDGGTCVSKTCSGGTCYFCLTH